MRAALREIETIERYLLKQMNPAELAEFESAMNASVELKNQVAVQKEMMEGLERIGLKSDTQSGFRRYKIRKWSLQLGIPFAAILIGAGIWYFSTIETAEYCDCEEADNPHPQTQKSSEIPAKSCKDTCNYFNSETISGSHKPLEIDTLMQESNLPIEPLIDAEDEVQVEEVTQVSVEKNSEWQIDHASNNQDISEPSEMEMSQVEPQFPGGKDAMLRFIRDHIKYPENSFKRGITGAVHVKFEISEKGKLSDFSIHQSVNAEMDAEALRIIKLMPDWKPGLINQQPTEMTYILPIVFGITE